MHRIYCEMGIPAAPGEVMIDGDEAAHAVAVKRLRAGEAVSLLDGRGGVAFGSVAEEPAGGKRAKSRTIRVAVDRIESLAPVRPRLELFTATPKGGRLDDMIDGLSQTGAAAWRPLQTARAVVDPRSTKIERVRRIAVEAMKQCGRAWMMEIGEPVGFEDAFRHSAGVGVVVADAGGAAVDPPASADSGDCIRVLIGPEGGFTPDELALAAAAGARRVRLGPHVMRIEVAALAAAAIFLSRTGVGSV